MQIETNIGANIKKVRKAKGLSQEEVAQLTGVQRPMVANIENDKRRPSIDFMIKFAKACDASLDEITMIEIPEKEKLDIVTDSDVNLMLTSYHDIHEEKILKTYIKDLGRKIGQLNDENKEARSALNKVLSEIAPLKKR